jgi:hypothetical protein
MRRRNHDSRLRGIPKTNLQASVAPTPESLQSQKRSIRQNRLPLKSFGCFSRTTTSHPANRCRTTTSNHSTAGCAMRASQRKPVSQSRSGSANHRRLGCRLQHQEVAFFARLQDAGRLCRSSHATGHRALLHESSARWPVTDTAPKGVSTAETLTATG